MEEMSEVDFEGRKYVWDGDSWSDAKTFMVPPDDVVNRLNAQYRRHEVTATPSARARAARKTGGPASASPRDKAPKRFVPIKPKPDVAAAPSPRTVEKITDFTGDNAWLANDFPAAVYHDGQRFESVDAALSAAKDLHDKLRLNMQREWDEEKRVPLMRKLLLSKFSNPELRAKLLATNEKFPMNTAEGADPFWHAPDGTGENMLGRLLIELRALLGKSYHLHADDTIVEHLRGYRDDNPMVPDDALTQERSWLRISELAEMYKDELAPGLKATLEARRNELLSAKATA
ncbi:MAG TPA: NADAR family protein [Tepidisphaeraceae bacterium]|nr:NADAR family protein [Tepidisphaeraceae bacterium]